MPGDPDCCLRANPGGGLSGKGSEIGQMLGKQEQLQGEGWGGLRGGKARGPQGLAKALLLPEGSEQRSRCPQRPQCQAPAVSAVFYAEGEQLGAGAGAGVDMGTGCLAFTWHHEGCPAQTGSPGGFGDTEECEVPRL